MDLNQIKQKLESLQTQSNTNKGGGKSIILETFSRKTTS